MQTISKFEQAARQIKARKMASALLDQAPASYWLTSEATHPAPPDFWATVAQAAGVRAPSATTWALVLELLRADALFCGEAVA